MTLAGRTGDQQSRLWPHAEEQLRRGSAKATEHIARRFGTRLPMWIGCGYPKSGTVWLCQLLSSCLDVPFPRDYAMPILMRSVIHAHWRYHPQLPPAVYICRDGRDVMVSLYFFRVRALGMDSKPRRAARLQARFQRLFGRGFDPQAVRENLPRFIEAEMRRPRAVRGVSWQRHLHDWQGRSNVTYVSYEGLLAAPKAELSRIVQGLTGEPADPVRIAAAVERFDFQATAGRNPGQEDRSEFLRKGIAGDWTNHFSREAGEIFDAYAGDALVEFGFADNRQWFRSL